MLRTLPVWHVDASRFAQDGETSVHMAASHANVETIRTLHDIGADLEATDKARSCSSVRATLKHALTLLHGHSRTGRLVTPPLRNVAQPV